MDNVVCCVCCVLLCVCVHKIKKISAAPSVTAFVAQLGRAPDF